MDTLRAITCFTSAVEAGSIAGGAKRLGISPAAASQQLARLEAHLDTRLLTRTTRRLGLTDSGTAYYARVKHIARDIERAHDAIASLRHEPRGHLRIASTAAFGRHVLAPLIPDFTRRYPHLSLEILTTDRHVDHIGETVDVSVRFAPQLEEGLVARRIASIPFFFCASPDYLARAGTPREPEDLKEHDCLVFRFPRDGRFLSWGFIRDGLRFEPDTRVAMISDDIDVLAQMALQGGGITRLAAFIARPHLDRGHLISLFETNRRTSARAVSEPMDIYLCVGDRRDLTPKVRAFMTFLIESLPVEWRPE
ncbi:LysR substrate-binding domain-containing protein [Halomonas sp. I1]|uniref:LysR family transcriptional regulator n=1 Tax=Halomonas sp. I1 TaxID=393536 RepID=UPI0028E055BA|nr:LysR substrate-binding domain-containing protein [Halomonas sp. I1]MDT8895357.1 LysR substrate-binding domain-containing protein [Halomonas sp. I1]